MTALHPRMNIRIWHLPNSNGELTNAGALIADESPVRHSRVFCTRRNGLTKAPGLMDGTMVQNLDVLNVPSRRRNPVIADIFMPCFCLKSVLIDKILQKYGPSW